MNIEKNAITVLVKNIINKEKLIDEKNEDIKKLKSKEIDEKLNKIHSEWDNHHNKLKEYIDSPDFLESFANMQKESWLGNELKPNIL